MSFQHEGIDANGNTYTYEYVTIGSNQTGRVAPMSQTYFEILGLNYVNAYRGPDSIFATTFADGSANPDGGFNGNYTVGDVGSLQTRNSTLAIMATSNNVAPDEYMWNYCCWANGAEISADRMAVDHGNDKTIGTGAVSVTIGGTEYADFPRDVYMECNILAGSGDAAYGNNNYLAWIDLENQRENRPKTGEYNPYFATYSAASGGGAAMVAGLHTLANTIDAVVAQSADANGNYTLQSRYGGNVPNGTGAAIDKYEDLVQATQYYVLSKLGDSKKAVTATLIGYDPLTGNYACRKYAVDAADKDANVYGGRVAGYLATISTSITELGLDEAQAVTVEAERPYVAWYTPEQIVANCDAAFICDAASSNNISTYLATSSDNACHVVYKPGTVTYLEEDCTAGLIQAREKALAADANAHVANFCFSYPANMFSSFYAQGAENGMLALITSSFTYPEYFGSNGLTDLLAYWAKYVWHIKDSSLQTIVEGTCSYMSMTGLSIGTISSDFEANAEEIFIQGNNYYLANKDAIDAINYGNLKTFDAEALRARTPERQPDPIVKPDPVVEPAAQTITVAKESFAKKATDKPFSLGAKAKTKLTYSSSNAKVATVDASGKVTVKGAGTAKITIKAAATDAYKAATKTVTVKVTKAANTMKASAKVKAVSVKAGMSVAASKAIKVASAKGKVTYAKTKGNAKITVANGKIKVNKGIKKGVYLIKVKVTAAGNAKYAKAAKTVSFKVKVV